MSYSYNKFLRPLATTDRNILIQDNSLILKYTIDPFSVLNVLANNNLLKINLRGGRLIMIAFSTANEARQALFSFKQRQDILTEKVPLFIDKKIENYVANEIATADKLGPTGPTGPGYSGTSSTTVEIPEPGYVIYLDTQPHLAWTPGQEVIIYNEIPNLIVEDDYYEDGTTSYMVGTVDYYNKSTGSFSFVVNESVGIGTTFSTWYLNLTGLNGEIGATTLETHLIPATASTYDIGATALGWRNIYSDRLIVKGLTISASGSSINTNSLILGKDVTLSTNGSGGLLINNNLVESAYGNGLITNGPTVSIGGTLSSSLELNGNGYDLIFKQFDNLMFTSSVYDVVADLISLDSKDALQIISDSELTLVSNGQLSIGGSSSFISINDGKGFVYYDDYSATFVTHSLVDKGYVDNAINTIVGNNNELSEILTNGRDVDVIGDINDNTSTTSININSRKLYNSSGSDILSYSASTDQGLVYLDDYSANFETRSLVDKGYVDIGTASIWSYIQVMSANTSGSSGTSGTSGLSGIDGASSLRWIMEDAPGVNPSGNGLFTVGYSAGLVNITLFKFSLNSLNVAGSQGFWDTIANSISIGKSAYLQVAQVDNPTTIALYKVNNVFWSGFSYEIGVDSPAVYGNGTWEPGKEYSVSFSITGANGTSGTSGSSGTSGLGTNGSSGTSGNAGSSGTSGIASNGPQNYSQVLGTQSSNVTTIGTTIVSGSITTTGGPVKIMVTGDANPQTPSGWVRLQIYRDSTPIGNIIQAETSGNNVNVPYCINVIDTPSTGTYTYSMRTVSGISGTFQFGEADGPTLTMVELTGSGTSGSSGTSGTSGSAGTSGETPTTNWSLSGNLTVAGTSSFSGLTVLQEVTEVVNTSPGATASTVVYDFSTGSIWYHSSTNTNYEASFINVPIDNNRAVTTTIIISQGGTAYIPHAVQINSSPVTIRWSGGTASGSANQVDIVGFTFIRDGGGNWAQVLGQINTFD